MMIPNEAFLSAFKTSVLCARRQIHDRLLQFIDGNRFAIELERVLGIDTDDRVLDLRWRFALAVFDSGRLICTSG